MCVKNNVSILSEIHAQTDPFFAWKILTSRGYAIWQYAYYGPGICSCKDKSRDYHSEKPHGLHLWRSLGLAIQDRHLGELIVRVKVKPEDVIAADNAQIAVTSLEISVEDWKEARLPIPKYGIVPTSREV